MTRRFAVAMSLPMLRASIRALADTAGVTPGEAVLHAGAGVELHGLTGNENDALAELVRVYRRGCESVDAEGAPQGSPATGRDQRLRPRGEDPLEGWPA